MFKVGDVIEVIDRGQMYGSYREWANENDLIGWEPDTELLKGDVGLVIRLSAHTAFPGDKLAGVLLDRIKKPIIINIKGIKKLTKKSMSNEKLLETLNEALTVKNKIKRIEVEVLADLKEHLKQLSEKLMREMSDEDIRVAGNEDGNVTIVERRGSIKINKEALMKDLELDDLSKYEQEGKGSKFLKYTITKKTNG
jgi:hypothetical protein